MRLKHLNISIDSYGVNEGRYSGTVSFDNLYGTVSLNLDPDTSDAILAVVADKLVSSARTLGTELTSACLTPPSPAIPEFLRKQAE